MEGKEFKGRVTTPPPDKTPTAPTDTLPHVERISIKKELEVVTSAMLEEQESEIKFLQSKYKVA